MVIELKEIKRSLANKAKQKSPKDKVKLYIHHSLFLDLIRHVELAQNQNHLKEITLKSKTRDVFHSNEKVFEEVFCGMSIFLDIIDYTEMEELIIDDPFTKYPTMSDVLSFFEEKIKQRERAFYK